MDAETKELLSSLREALTEKKKFNIQNVIIPVLVGFILAIPTIIVTTVTTLNKVENKLIEIETKANEKIKELDKAATIREKNLDYNFNMLEKLHPELDFIKLENTYK